MTLKSKFSAEEKLKAVEDYLLRKRGVSQICAELQISKSSFGSWLHKYQVQGKQGLEPLSHNTYYPETLKLNSVTDYLDGKGSIRQICSKYGIISCSLLRFWIKKYNGHEAFKSHNAQGDEYVTKGRKTTYEERTRIVAFCIENNDNYILTSQRFKVSYQQVYTWVQKYKQQGHEALIDRRGKQKEAEELSDSKKFDIKLKLLEAENRRLKMENDFLKKLNEVERRG